MNHKRVQSDQEGTILKKLAKRKTSSAKEQEIGEYQSGNKLDDYVLTIYTQLNRSWKNSRNTILRCVNSS